MTPLISSSRLLLVITVIASAVLGFLGVLYLLASPLDPTHLRLWVGIILIGIALVLVAFASKSLVKPPPITVQWSPSGEVKLEELKCPNCNAPLKIENPSVTRVVCQYCGRVVEIVEEPKW